MNDKECYEECLHHICNLFNIVLAHAKIEDEMIDEWYKIHWKTSFKYEIEELKLLINKHFELKEKYKRMCDNVKVLGEGYDKLENIFETATSWEEAQERYLKDE